MQTVSASFTTASQAALRKPIAKAEISWTKQIDPAIDFFTIGVSLIGGADVIKGDVNDISHNEDYVFENESIYVESIEIESKLEEPVMSVARTMADVVLDNNTDRFTPDGGSSIDDYIRTQRIIRLSLGFDYGSQEFVQKFIGVNVDYPTLDITNKRVSIHALDWAFLLWDKEVQRTAMFVNQTTDIILRDLLVAVGVPPDKLRLNQGINVIPFAYFYKGQNLGNIIKKLCEAELGIFYVDEEGNFIFLSRDAWTRSPYNTSVFTIPQASIVSQRNPNTDMIINAVEVRGKPRQLGQNQLLWSLLQPIEIAAGDTYRFFIDYTDPVYDIDIPTPLGVTSKFKAGFANDITDFSATEYCEVTSFTKFATSSLIGITNNNASNSIWVTQLDIFGQPARVVGGVFGTAEDDDSIDEFGRHLIQIENDFIQSDDFANTTAQLLVSDRSDISNYKELVIRGIPQLQLGDRVTLSTDGEEYHILRSRLKLTGDDGLVQELTLVSRVINSYFRVGISTIGGDDLIGP